MTRRLALFLLCLSCVASAQSTPPAGFVALTASRIQGATGGPLSSGTLNIQPTDGSNNPITASAGGVGGQITTNPIAIPVTNGAIPSGTFVADTALTRPANISFRLTIRDATGTAISTLKLVQPSSVLSVAGQATPAASWCSTSAGVTSCNLDAYQPDVAPQAVVQLGPQGLSAYQVWLSVGNTGTQTQFLASLVGPTTPAQLGTASRAADLDIWARLGQSSTQNLFSPAMVVGAGAYSTADGSIVSGQGIYNYASLIYVAGYSQITTSQTIDGCGGIGSVFLDANKAIIPAGTINDCNGTVGTWTVPTGAVYLGLSLRTFVTTSTLMVVGGTGLPAGGAYVPYGFQSPDLTTIANVQAQIFALLDAIQPAQRNLFDASRYVPNVIFDANCYNHPTYYSSGLGGCVAPGYLGFYANGGLSDFIPVTAGTTYTLNYAEADANSVQGGVFFDANKIPIASSLFAVPFSAGFTITAPVTGYVRIPMRTASVSTAMMTIGSTAYTGPYIPFAQNPSTTQTRSPWNGKTFGVLGDSYSAAFANIWQLGVAAYHNMTQVFQDARADRPIFGAGSGAYGSGTGAGECYGNDLISGTFTPTYTPETSYGTCAAASPQAVSGNTFTQNVTAANPDLFFIALGTNSFSFMTVGTTMDTAGAATMHGGIKAVLNGVHHAKPGMRVIWIEPLQVGDTTNGRASQMPIVSQAIEQECALYGDPVIKMWSESGVNSYTWGTLLLTDLVHPSTFGFQHMFIPKINLALNGITPLD